MLLQAICLTAHVAIFLGHILGFIECRWWAEADQKWCTWPPKFTNTHKCNKNQHAILLSKHLQFTMATGLSNRPSWPLVTSYKPYKGVTMASVQAWRTCSHWMVFVLIVIWPTAVCRQCQVWHNRGRNQAGKHRRSQILRTITLKSHLTRISYCFCSFNKLSLVWIYLAEWQKGYHAEHNPGKLNCTEN